MSNFIVTFTLAAIVTSKLATIKALRQLSGISLKEGKDLVEAAARENQPMRVRVTAEQLADFTRRVHASVASDYRAAANMSSKGFNLIGNIEAEQAETIVDLVHFGPSRADY